MKTFEKFCLATRRAVRRRKIAVNGSHGARVRFHVTTVFKREGINALDLQFSEGNVPKKMARSKSANVI